MNSKKQQNISILKTFDGNERLIRTVKVDEKIYRGELVITKEEFLLAYNTWVRGDNK